MDFINIKNFNFTPYETKKTIAFFSLYNIFLLHFYGTIEQIKNFTITKNVNEKFTKSKKCDFLLGIISKIIDIYKR